MSADGPIGSMSRCWISCTRLNLHYSAALLDLTVGARDFQTHNFSYRMHTAQPHWNSRKKWWWWKKTFCDTGDLSSFFLAKANICWWTEMRTLEGSVSLTLGLLHVRYIYKFPGRCPVKESLFVVWALLYRLIFTFREEESLPFPKTISLVFTMSWSREGHFKIAIS